MKTREGLPFVCTRYMKMLLESVMARVQRDEKVILCHFLWMGNHPHIIVRAKDKRACTQFYGEVQKQLTEAVKRLAGLKHLSLWKGNATSVIPYYDVETVCYRIAYLYANPARANLVDTISEYPGFSSYRAFKRGAPSLDTSSQKECPWVRAPLIEVLSRKSVSAREDSRICTGWKKEAQESHTLVVYPNAWMKGFGIEGEDEIKETNERIRHYLLDLEQEARKKRKKKPMGAKRLSEEPLDLTYRSKKESRRIFVYSLDRSLRTYLIAAYHQFCDRCRECYERWKLGDLSVDWPPGSFCPPAPHRQNDFCPEVA